MFFGKREPALVTKFAVLSIRPNPFPPRAPPIHLVPEMNVVLMGRSEAALEEVAKSLRSSYGVEVNVVVADLSDVSADNLETIAAELEDLDVGVLVNNAGMSYDHFDDLEAVDADRLAQLVQLNCTSLMLLTRAVLPGMKSRRRGLVLNVSSGSADMPSCPLLSVYAASKRFVDSFSVSMDYELRTFNVRCQVVAPMYVVSKLSKFRRASLFVAHPDAYAAATMRFLGRETVCWPFWTHALMLGAIKAVPACIFNNRYLVYARGMQRAFYKRQKRVQLAKKDE